MRFFIALEIPPESRQELESIQQQLKQIFPEVRLTDNNKLHLTIAFIGDKPDKIKEPLIAAINQAAKNLASFEVTPAYLDGFPHLHGAHIFWVGVKGDIDKLFVVRERVKDELVKLGLEVDERRYIPHIAIAKAKWFDLQPQEERKLEKMMNWTFKPIQITSIKLFESIPEEGFHKHNTLAEIPLQSFCEVDLQEQKI